MRIKKMIISLLMLIGVIILTGFFVAVIVTYNRLLLGQLYFAKGLGVYIVVYIALLMAVTKMYGGYEIGTHRIFEVAFSNILSITFVNIITYLQISLTAKGFIHIDYMIGLTIIQFIFATLWTIMSNKIYYSIINSSQMLLIYGKAYPTELIEKLKENNLKYHLSETLCETELPNTNFHFITQDTYDIMIHQVTPLFASNIKEYCFKQNIRLYIVPEIADILINHAERIELSDTPILFCNNSSISTIQETTKRLMDILISATMLLILSPFMIFVAVAIKLNTRGPIIYKQQRLTKGGKTFMLYKFRSMINDAEPNGVAQLSAKSDDRITRVGRVIRKIRFDEVPQFFNVLRGDMSIVGPRPERQVIALKYEEEIPEFSNRLKMKAGITGYAQVYGKYNTSPRDKLIMDIIYINNYSIIFDMKLILLTIKIVFIPSKTVGF